jgi:hypothetical protein
MIMGLGDIISGISSGTALNDAASSAGIDPSQAPAMLQGLLDHVNGGGSLEDAAGAVAGKLGVDPSQVEQFLPQVAGLLQGHADSAPDGGGDLIGGLLGKFGL